MVLDIKMRNITCMDITIHRPQKLNDSTEWYFHKTIFEELYVVNFRMNAVKIFLLLLIKQTFS